MAEYEPLEDSSAIMSAPRRRFWNQALSRKSPLKQTRKALFQYAMNTTPRPTAQTESIEFGYAVNEKLHDREPDLLVKEIEKVDPTFFDDYPRLDVSKPMSSAEKRAAVGEAARAFYRHGLSGYGKPALRANALISPL